MFRILFNVQVKVWHKLLVNNCSVAALAVWGPRVNNNMGPFVAVVIFTFLNPNL